ncbi:nucleotidyl transferase AbiEii/AbiGii toxin family protein, partial [Variovorax sp. 22077]|uniref:nucleotidyl transferase AbiEii/AbiGii toxin family protein n=1 Tax=Variovorax sp. 22077 TaxID=3453867 RepID=UPI003F839828
MRLTGSSTVVLRRPHEASHERSCRLLRQQGRKPFARALALIDEITRYGGIADPFWTFGGGTVLMFRYRHRLSKDIDIFVP